MSATVSVIIPVLNEEAIIETTVVRAGAIADEVIVVDGGSTDRTLELLRPLDCTTISGPRGRGQQIYAGSKIAKGAILLFLHADTWLPVQAKSQILDCWDATSSSEKPYFCGCFEQRIEDARLIYRWLEKGNLWRARYQRLPYGDQGVFVSRELYDAVEGMPQIPLMEDFEFARLISKRGKMKILPGPIHVSARRWEKVGPIRQTIRNWTLALRYRLGAKPESLLSKY
ncbi:TIGR04283 family arsenosugar biosynthesis glycosyltransferase [Mariniblastus fucicola]|uniref:Glycosyl transferase family 2 n=1 Tax=Mariniblastus fucicola TaxID=980251 RepID=A0A5B9P6R9_9BACT|nr:TIGR04283 family arsenosugar biosynthesis glycosyltransferase [Mariniblastus fucicola]QEG20875.1 Glycosyl transferase family 2 [Mariniblastus fucicola]